VQAVADSGEPFGRLVVNGDAGYRGGVQRLDAPLDLFRGLLVDLAKADAAALAVAAYELDSAQAVRPFRDACQEMFPREKGRPLVLLLTTGQAARPKVRKDRSDPHSDLAMSVVGVMPAESG
jgi:hypothetical protein